MAAGVATNADAVWQDGYLAPSCKATGVVRSTLFHPEGYALWQVDAELSEGAELRWDGDGHGEEAVYVDHSTSAHDAADQREELARLRDALGQLRDEEKEVFLLRQNGGLTYEQIGARLHQPVGVTKSRMRAPAASEPRPDPGPSPPRAATARSAGSPPRPRPGRRR